MFRNKTILFSFTSFRMLDVTRILWIYVPPVIILAGTVGNALTLITVTNKRIQKNSFIIYLGALAVSDTASLYIITLNGWLFFGFDIDIMMGRISCKILSFMYHVVMMLSSLLVAVLSTDRMLCICFPLKKEIISTPKSAKFVLSFIIGFIIVINIHELYGFRLTTIQNATLCTFIDDSYARFYDIYFAWVDTLFYFILPTIIIVVTNILTVREVIKANKLARHAMNVPAIRNRIRNERQVIFMAIAVSVAFLVLTSPIGILVIIRSYVFTDSEVFYSTSDTEFVMTIFWNLASINFAINFVLYFVSGKRFRENLSAACFCGRSSRVAPVS